MINSKTKCVFILMLVSILAGVIAVSAADSVETRQNYTINITSDPDLVNHGDWPGIYVEELKINGDIADNHNAAITVYERDQVLDVKAIIFSYENLSNVEVEASIFGYEYNSNGERLSDSSEIMDIKAGRRYPLQLSVKLPDKMETGNYKLRIIIADRDSALVVSNYDLDVYIPRHSLKIQDVIFSPEGEVKAGRALLSTVKVKNMGYKDEDSVKIKVSIPELGISASDYIDTIESEEVATSEELYMRIPDCAEEGDYTATVSAEYEDGYSIDEKKYLINVVQSDSCDIAAEDSTDDTDGNKPTDSPKTIITIGPESQEVKQGEGGVVYPVTITNAGKTAKTYTVSVSGADDWATIRVSPSNVVVLGPGESSAIYVYLSAKETAAEGGHMFSVAVTSGTETLKQIPLTATVTKTEVKSEDMDSVKKGLMISLFVLVALLIIIGLIIGFSKLKSGEDKEQEPEETSAGQTYY